MPARWRSPQTLVRRKPPNLNGAAAVYWAARGVLGARAPAYLLAASRPGRAERGGRTLARASWSRRRAGSYQATQLERGAQNGKLSVQWLDGAKWAAASRPPRTTGRAAAEGATPPCVRTSPKKKAPGSAGAGFLRSRPFAPPSLHSVASHRGGRSQCPQKEPAQECAQRGTKAKRHRC
ncbi:hypothetical protein MRX96_010337 [Rhipicephalus microplus]